jgi:hypothetical protein
MEEQQRSGPGGSRPADTPGRQERFARRQDGALQLVHPTRQYLEECPQVKGHVLGLSDRHAKFRRSGYRKSAAELIAAPRSPRDPALVCALVATRSRTGPTPWASTNRWSRQHGESEVGRPGGVDRPRLCQFDPRGAQVLEQVHAVPQQDRDHMDLKLVQARAPTPLTGRDLEVYAQGALSANREGERPAIRREGANRPSGGIGRGRGPKVIQARAKIVVAEDFSIERFHRG